MRVLHVVHRILVGMRSEQVQVDVDRGIVVGACQRITGGIHADSVGQIVDGHHIAGALRHAHCLAVLQHVDELADKNLHVFARFVAECGAHGHHAADIAVMVGTQHVNGDVCRIVVTMTLVAIVSNISCEIRVVAVGLDNHTILVVTMLGGFEPGCAILFVNVAAFTQIGDRLVDFAIGIQAVLMEPHVEIHTEILHGFADFVEHHRHCTLAEFLTLFGIALTQRIVIVVNATVDARQVENRNTVGICLIDDATCDLIDISALVTVDRGFLTVGGRDQRLGETVDLLAVIVEIVFAHHLGAVRLKHAGHGVADRGPTGAADMDRTGRIGGHEFKIQGLAGKMVVLAVVRTLVKHSVNHGCGGRGIKHNVNEAGAGHFHGLDAIGIGEFRGEQFGEIVRLHAGLLGQLHGRVRRPIAVRAVLRTHDGEFGLRRDEIGGQGACLAFIHKVVGNIENQFTKRFWTHSSKSTDYADRISLAYRPAYHPAVRHASCAKPPKRNSRYSRSQRTESYTAMWNAATNRKSPKPTRRYTSQSQQSARTGNRGHDTSNRQPNALDQATACGNASGRRKPTPTPPVWPSRKPQPTPNTPSKRQPRKTTTPTAIQPC